MKSKFGKIIACCASLTLAAALTCSLAACGKDEGAVTISGSTSVQPLMEKLEEAFEKKNKDVDIQVLGGGSSVGVSDAEKGTSDIGMVSRALKEKELEKLDGTKLCDDGIVLIVNKDSGVTNVTSDEVYNLYASGTAISTITIPVNRTAGSGTRDGFCELIKNAEGKTLKDFQAEGNGNSLQGEEQESTNVVITTVAGVKNKIGYISLGSLNDTVKAVSLDGVAPSVATIKDGSYKLQRPFVLATKKGAELSEAAQRFWDFIMGAEGQAIVTAQGYIAL